MPFPRCKGNLYDTGTRVPLAMRWPQMLTPGRVVEQFVSLTDLAPTFLELAGLAVPGSMTGSSLKETQKQYQLDRFLSQLDRTDLLVFFFVVPSVSAIVHLRLEL